MAASIGAIAAITPLCDQPFVEGSRPYVAANIFSQIFPTMKGSSPITRLANPLRKRSAPPPEPSPYPETPASVWLVAIRRDAFGWWPPLGALGVQKRSFVG